MSANGHLLVVDDEVEIGRLLTTYFEGKGYAVTAVNDGESMRSWIATNPVDLVLLDLNLPDEDGISLARHLREHVRCGIIIVTGSDDPVERIVGLEVGADDYVTKPFDYRELLARVRSVMRRVHYEPGESMDTPSQSPLTFDGWVLDRQRRQLCNPDGEPVRLTGGEFSLLELLVQHANQIVTRDFLIEKLYHREASPIDRGVDIQIARLRRKLGDDPTQPRLIKTVRAAGYLFAAPVAQH